MSPEASTAHEWLALARRDHAFLATIDDGYVEHVIFHAQQVVEKALKAVVAHTGVTPLHTHSIERLLHHVRTLEVPDALRESVWLTESYVVVRYFVDEPAPTDEQTAEARRAADIAVAWAATIIDSPAG